MAQMHISKIHKINHFLSFPSISISPPNSNLTFFFFSTWYNPQPEHDPILTTLSEAIKNTQTKPLDTSLKNLMPSLTVRHVINLINLNPHSLSPPSLLYFFHWVSSQPNFRNTINAYSTMTHFLCFHQMHSDAQSLLRFLVSRKGKDSASSLFASLYETRHHSTAFVFSALMNAYTNSGFVSDAIQCFRLIKYHNLPIPFPSCGHLLDKLMRLSSPGASWAFYSEILDCGYPPNVYKFNILMHALCKDGKMKDAHMVFDEIRNRRLRPTVVSYNTLINGYCKSGNLEEAFRLMRRSMADSKISPDVFTYSVLIDGLCKVGRLDDANILFKELCDKGLVPNDVTFTTLINGHCKHGKIGLAMEIYEKMLEQGVRPDLITYNTLINGLCKDGKLEEARQLVSEMSRKELKPDRITYTTLIDGFYKEGDLESALETRKEMIKEGIELDNVAFTALISGLCVQGRVIDAERTLREMLKAGMKPDDATYTMVIDGYCKKGDVKMGFKLLKEMQKDGNVPGVVTYNVLMNGLCKQGQIKNANMLLDAMLNLGVIPDDITYNILLDGQCKHGKPEEDLDRLRSEKGLVSDYASYTSLVNELGRTSKDRQRR